MANPSNISNGSVLLTEKIEAYLQAHSNNNHFMGSVLINREREVLLSKGYGTANLEHNVSNTSLTKFRLGSITKQFTATAILKLQEQNLVDINNFLATYLPEYPNGEQISVHHLLSHTSGIPIYTSFDSI